MLQAGVAAEAFGRGVTCSFAHGVLPVVQEVRLCADGAPGLHWLPAVGVRRHERGILVRPGRAQSCRIDAKYYSSHWVNILAGLRIARDGQGFRRGLLYGECCSFRRSFVLNQRPACAGSWVYYETQRSRAAGSSKAGLGTAHLCPECRWSYMGVFEREKLRDLIAMQSPYYLYPPHMRQARFCQKGCPVAFP